MSACFKLRGVWSALSPRCVCRHVRLVLPVQLRPLSYLTTRQIAKTKLQTQTGPAFHVVHQRQETTFSRKRRTFKGRNEEDGVGPGLKLVYDNNMNRLSFWGQVVINGLALPIYGMSLKVIYSCWPNLGLGVTSGSLGAALYIFAYSLLLTGVNGICRRSIQRIYTDADATKFAAVVRDWKMTSKTLHFDLSSVERKPPGRITGVFLGNVKILGRSYLISPSDFALPRFYNVLMGYEMQRSIQLDLVQDQDIRDMINTATGRKLDKPPEKEDR